MVFNLIDNLIINTIKPGVMETDILKPLYHWRFYAPKTH